MVGNPDLRTLLKGTFGAAPPTDDSSPCHDGWDLISSVEMSRQLRGQNVVRMQGGAAVQMVMEPFTSPDEYLAWADQRPDEEHYEVVDGVPVMSPSPGGWHQFALAQLLLTLSAACPSDHVVLPVPLDWVLWQAPRLQIREPDLPVIPRSAARAPRLTDAPLLAVEILSPTSFERDVVAKRREYALAGLDHYWIVDPQTPQVAAYRRKRFTTAQASSGCRAESRCSRRPAPPPVPIWRTAPTAPHRAESTGRRNPHRASRLTRCRLPTPARHARAARHAPPALLL